MRSRRFRWLVLGPLLYFVLHIGACQVYDNVYTPRTARGLDRGTVETAAGLRVSYLSTAGADDVLPRIVYVHGTPGNADAFEAYLLDPIEGFRGIAIDRPGFGLTRPRRAESSLEEQAKAIEPFLEARGGQWPILIGHSLGAPIIARAAVDFPDRVGGLVILSGSLDPKEESVYGIQRLGDWGPFPLLIPSFLRNSNRELLPLRSELEALEPLLEQIRVPVSILHSTDDILVPYRNVEYMKARIPEPFVHEIIVFEDKDHFIPWNAEDEIRAAIESLARVAARRAVPAS